MSSYKEPGPARWHIGVWLAVAVAALAACAPPAVSGAPGGSSAEPSTVGSATSGSNETPVPAASPASTSAAGAVPPLLEPPDLGPDWRIEEEVVRGDRGLGIVGNMCWQAYQSPSLSHITGDRSRVLTNRPASVQGSENDGYQAALIEVWRFEADWAARHLDEWRGRMDKNCTLEPNTYRLTTVETQFAGDEALLVLFTYGSTSNYLAWVRKGDLVMMIYGSGLDRNLVRKAAVAAAARAR
jgi:hypothetical protein